MLKLIKYLKNYRLHAVVAPLLKFVEALFELIIPLVVADIIDNGIALKNENAIIKNGLIMIGLGAAGLLFSLSCQYLAAVSSLGYGTNLRRKLFRHINSLSFSELDKIGSSALLTRMTSDVNQTQTAVAMFIRLITRVPFIVIGAAVMAFTINFELALVFVIGAAVISVILFTIMHVTVPAYSKVQHRLDTVNELTEENLAGARVVRAFGKQAEECRDFDTATEKLNVAAESVGRISALLNPLSYAVMNCCIIAVVAFGSFKADGGAITQGQLIALVNYLSQILLAMIVFANLIVIFTKASASAARINEVLALSPSIKDNVTENINPILSAPIVRFDDVSFSYNADKLSLKNVSFSLNGGSALGIIGATGSGKSTLVNLIPRFYDTTSGSVEVYGTDVKKFPLSQLRSYIGVVAQKTGLFSGTIRENMQMGNDSISDETIIDALKTAQAYDFVQALPDFLSAHVEAGGKNFSGGQRQRLTIARAIAKNPKLLVLDDSSSALDTLTDSRLFSALSKKNDLSMIIVSQRCGTVRNADKILVLDDGESVGYGTHAELFKSCQIYREICASQGVTD